MTTDLFVPPAAKGLPLAALNSATEGADRLDAAALTPTGRNFLAHALVQLARDGWLRTEPGEGFEPVSDQETTREPQDAPAAEPPVSRAALRDRIAEALMAWADSSNNPQYATVRRPETVVANAYSRADVVLAVLPEPTDRAAVLTPTERDMLRYALELAEEQALSRGDEFAEDDITALDRLRRLADEEQPAAEAKPPVGYGGKGRVFCLACPRPVDENVPVAVDSVDPWDLCPSCGRHVVDVARATKQLAEPPCCSDPTCACDQVNAEGRCACAKWQSGSQPAAAPCSDPPCNTDGTDGGLPAVLRIVASWYEDVNDGHGLDASDLVHTLEQAGFPLADDVPLDRFYSHEKCGFHWHGRDGLDIPMRDGQPICPRCELERLTASVS